MTLCEGSMDFRLDRLGKRRFFFSVREEGDGSLSGKGWAGVLFPRSCIFGVGMDGANQK
jgi:hypothetical protein